MIRLYDLLSRIQFLRKSYSLKFLFIAFLGIHIPLIGLVTYVSVRPAVVSPLNVIVVTLILTLAATAITLLVLNSLLMPLHKSSQALDQYITERKTPELPVHYRDEAGRLMQNIQLTVMELDELLEEKKDLISLLSHDLRTPLHNIKMLGNVLKTETDPSTRGELVDMIMQSCAEQSRLLESILNLLRQDHTLEAETPMETLGAEELVDDVLHVFAAPAKDKNIRLSTNIEFRGNLEVKPDLFKQAVKNLVSNAIKFSHPDSEVKLSVRRTASETVIEVMDAGIGFDPKAQHVLFDRFTNYQQKGTAGEASMGIGLSMSRKIIKRHKGELTAESAGLGKGATFTISLYQ